MKNLFKTKPGLCIGDYMLMKMINDKSQFSLEIHRKKYQKNNLITLIIKYRCEIDG